MSGNARRVVVKAAVGVGVVVQVELQGVVLEMQQVEPQVMLLGELLVVVVHLLD
jgi:hypothetical protein